MQAAFTRPAVAALRTAVRAPMQQAKRQFGGHGHDVSDVRLHSLSVSPTALPPRGARR